jgi:hypothetical protein
LANVLAWREWVEKHNVSESAQHDLHAMTDNGFSLRKVMPSSFLNRVVEEEAISNLNVWRRKIRGTSELFSYHKLLDTCKEIIQTENLAKFDYESPPNDKTILHPCQSEGLFLLLLLAVSQL